MSTKDLSPSNSAAAVGANSDSIPTWFELTTRTFFLLSLTFLVQFTAVFALGAWLAATPTQPAAATFRLISIGSIVVTTILIVCVYRLGRSLIRRYRIRFPGKSRSA
jgi:hypothetical protein